MIKSNKKEFRVIGSRKVHIESNTAYVELSDKIKKGWVKIFQDRKADKDIMRKKLNTINGISKKILDISNDWKEKNALLENGKKKFLKQIKRIIND